MKRQSERIVDRPAGPNDDDRATSIRSSELDQHAFIDNELDIKTRIRVIQELLANPEQAKELALMQLREDLLRNLIFETVNSPDRSKRPGKIDLASSTLRNRSITVFLAGFVLGLITAGATATLLL